MPVTRTYRKISMRRTIDIECSECTLVRRRTLSAWQTHNPFNTNADGSVKTVAEIYAELGPELDKIERAFRKTVFVCQRCEQDIKMAEELR